jgi:hypothetical protein
MPFKVGDIIYNRMEKNNRMRSDGVLEDNHNIPIGYYKVIDVTPLYAGSIYYMLDIPASHRAFGEHRFTHKKKQVNNSPGELIEKGKRS